MYLRKINLVAAGVLLGSFFALSCTHKKNGAAPGGGAPGGGGSTPVLVKFRQEGRGVALSQPGLSLASADPSLRQDFGGTLAVTSYSIDLDCDANHYKLEGGRMIVRSNETACSSKLTSITVADQHGLTAKFTSGAPDRAAAAVAADGPKIMSYSGPDSEHQGQMKLLLSGAADSSGSALYYTFTIKNLAAGDNVTGVNQTNFGSSASVTAAGVPLPDIDPVNASAWTEVNSAGLKSFIASIKRPQLPCGTGADYSAELYGQKRLPSEHAHALAHGTGDLALDGTPYFLTFDDQAIIRECSGLSTNFYLKLSCTNALGTSYKLISIETTIPASPFDPQADPTKSTYRCANAALESFVRTSDLPKLTINDSFLAGSPYASKLAVAPTGQSFMAYTDISSSGGGVSGKLSVKKLTNGAWTLVGSQNFSAGSASHLSLSFTTTSDPVVAYSDASLGGRAVVMKYDSSSSSWVQLGQGPASLGQAAFVSLAVAEGDGSVMVAYTDVGSGSRVNVAKLSSPGSAWEAVGQANFSPGAAAYVSLALNSAGKAYVAFSDLTDGGAAKSMTLNASGSTWGMVGTSGFALTDNTSISEGAAAYVSLVISADGKPYVAFVDEAHGSGMTVKYFDNNLNQWVSVGTQGFSASLAGASGSGSSTTGGSVSSPTFAVSSDGTPMVAYIDNSDGGKIVIAKFSTSTDPGSTPVWSTVSVLAQTDATSSVTLSFNSAGTPQVAFQAPGEEAPTVVAPNPSGQGWLSVELIPDPPPAAPVISQASKSFNAPFSVSLSEGIQAADFSSFRYTTDGSEPRCTNANIGSSVSVPAATTTLRAVACDRAGNVSAITEATYTYLSPCTVDGQTILSGDPASRTRYQTSSVAYGSSCVEETQTATCSNGTLGDYSGSYLNSACSVATAASCVDASSGATLAPGETVTRIRYSSALVYTGGSCSPETQTATCTNGTIGSYSGYNEADFCVVLGDSTLLGGASFDVTAAATAANVATAATTVVTGLTTYPAEMTTDLYAGGNWMAVAYHFEEAPNIYFYGFEVPGSSGVSPAQSGGVVSLVSDDAVRQEKANNRRYSLSVSPTSTVQNPVVGLGYFQGVSGTLPAFFKRVSVDRTASQLISPYGVSTSADLNLESPANRNNEYLSIRGLSDGSWAASRISWVDSQSQLFYQRLSASAASPSVSSSVQLTSFTGTGQKRAAAAAMSKPYSDGGTTRTALAWTTRDYSDPSGFSIYSISVAKINPTGTTAATVLDDLDFGVSATGGYRMFTTPLETAGSSKQKSDLNPVWVSEGGVGQIYVAYREETDLKILKLKDSYSSGYTSSLATVATNIFSDDSDYSPESLSMDVSTAGGQTTVGLVYSDQYNNCYFQSLDSSLVASSPTRLSTNSCYGPTVSYNPASGRFLVTYVEMNSLYTYDVKYREVSKTSSNSGDFDLGHTLAVPLLANGSSPSVGLRAAAITSDIPGLVLSSSSDCSSAAAPSVCNGTQSTAGSVVNNDLRLKWQWGAFDQGSYFLKVTPEASVGSQTLTLPEREFAATVPLQAGGNYAFLSGSNLTTFSNRQLYVSSISPLSTPLNPVVGVGYFAAPDGATSAFFRRVEIDRTASPLVSPYGVSASSSLGLESAANTTSSYLSIRGLSDGSWAASRLSPVVDLLQIFYQRLSASAASPSVSSSVQLTSFIGTGQALAAAMSKPFSDSGTTRVALAWTTHDHPSDYPIYSISVAKINPAGTTAATVLDDLDFGVATTGGYRMFTTPLETAGSSKQKTDLSPVWVADGSTGGQIYVAYREVTNLKILKLKGSYSSGYTSSQATVASAVFNTTVSPSTTQTLSMDVGTTAAGGTNTVGIAYADSAKRCFFNSMGSALSGGTRIRLTAVGYHCYSPTVNYNSATGRFIVTYAEQNVSGTYDVKFVEVNGGLTAGSLTATAPAVVIAGLATYPEQLTTDLYKDGSWMSVVYRIRYSQELKVHGFHVPGH